MGSCPRCDDAAEVGVLCARCAQPLAPCDGLMPDHLRSIATTHADAWLVDGFGAPHPVARARARIGRRPGSELVILHRSVSRDHAELARVADAWQLRDLGSRNWTRVDGHRVQGRGPLDEVAVVRIGEVALLFIGRPLTMPGGGERALVTTHAAVTGFRAIVRGATLELCVLGGGGEDAAGGALLHRAAGSTSWAELSLPPLEFQLLRTLCARALDEADSPSRSRGCVPTKQLARDLPFQSRYANEENVRQVVRRLRATLDGVGAGELIASAPGRGYFVSWPVAPT